MQVLLAIAIKSLLVAGLTLLLLAAMKRRSAAERSWVAHIGLLALVIMALAPLALPRWNIPAPALFAEEPVVQTVTLAATPTAANAPSHSISLPAAKAAPKPAATAAAPPKISTAAAATALYAMPAAILLLVTFLALVRLVTLRARADVLVDGHWLSALARAQRRMGFKHGTALLTSNELASPISWGLMRPVILLNTRAVEASGEAEAIIAHELAHVARMDWIKLLLARVATALFWFNPFVWVLAREAHQLREEAADDAVLAADIADTDYAQLLVGVARHECPGLLLGAHGVAPSKSSLARRVARVLDGKSVRGPVARSFALGVFAGAVLVAAPLAALTFTPGTRPQTVAVDSTPALAQAVAAAEAAAQDAPTDLPRIIASGVATSVASAVTAIRPSVKTAPNGDFEITGPSNASLLRQNGAVIARGSDGATVTVYPPGASGKSRMVARSANGATAINYVDAKDVRGLAAGHASGSRRENAIDTAIEMRAVGVTPEYIAAIRGASPALRNAEPSDLVALKALGVTPQYIRELAQAGLGNIGPDEIEEARAVGLTGAYVRAIRATGVRADLDDLIELKALNMSPDELARVRGAGALTNERVREVVVSPPPPAPAAPPPIPRGD